MRITREGELITLRDRPGPFWALGLLFLFGGGLAMAMPLGLATNAADLEPWERLASLAVGVCVGAGGIWWLRRSSATRAEIDLTRQRLTVVRLGLEGRRVIRLALSDVAGVEAERGSDSEGGSIWRPVLRLRSGEQVALSVLWIHDEKSVREAVAVVASACRAIA